MTRCSLDESKADMYEKKDTVAFVLVLLPVVAMSLLLLISRVCGLLLLPLVYCITKNTEGSVIDCWPGGTTDVAFMRVHGSAGVH
jgi:hypothetical protein